jgi:hypothetical protein
MKAAMQLADRYRYSTLWSDERKVLAGTVLEPPNSTIGLGA